ncbi:MAG: alpha/beta hydrolase [Gammaproteobacteria bacterium]|jgi:pimeloyl-ACP methyl ester carboxylesterase
MINKAFARLADSRTLAYSESGPAQGQPIIAFHGIPGSRLQHGSLTVLHEIGVRLIVVDRPGIGLSDFYEGRTLLDWPDDIAQLADSLSLNRFAVLGFSGGGIYAAACAYKIPHRITCTALLGCLAPLDVPTMADTMPQASRGLFETTAQDYRQAEQQLTQLLDSPEALFDVMEATAAPVDKKLFAVPDFRQMFLQNMAESCRQGLGGIAYDMSIAAKPWGFDPSEIETPVVLWHGTADANVPVAMGRYLAKTIAQCQAQFVPDAGHYFMFEHWEEILLRLTGQS